MQYVTGERLLLPLSPGISFQGGGPPPKELIKSFKCRSLNKLVCFVLFSFGLVLPATPSHSPIANRPRAARKAPSASAPLQTSKPKEKPSFASYAVFPTGSLINTGTIPKIYGLHYRSDPEALNASRGLESVWGAALSSQMN